MVFVLATSGKCIILYCTEMTLCFCVLFPKLNALKLNMNILPASATADDDFVRLYRQCCLLQRNHIHGADVPPLWVAASASSVSGTLASISGRNSPQKGLGSTPQPFRVNTRSTKTEIHELAIFKEGSWMGEILKLFEDLQDILGILLLARGWVFN